MERVEQHFDFERSALVLDCGSLFQAHACVSNRWIHCEDSVYGPSGLRARILYQLRDDRFVLVTTQSCSPEEVGDQVRKILWHCHQPPTGRYIDEFEAVEFLIEAHQPIPDNLGAALSAYEARQRQLRSTGPGWAGLIEMAKRRSRLKQLPIRDAHDVDFDHLAREVRVAFVRLLDELRRHLGHVDEDPKALLLSAQDVATCLTMNYGIQPERWWGVGTNPPDFVTIGELPWPPSMIKLRDGIGQLEEHVSIACQQLSHYPPASRIASLEEQRGRLIESLVRQIPNIERLVAVFTDSVKTAATKFPPPSAATPQIDLRPPVARAFAAYELAENALQAAGESVTDAAAYAWLKEKGLEEYELPTEATWKRYVRKARAHYGRQKNSRRAGRSGRSIASRDDLDA